MNVFHLYYQEERRRGRGSNDFRKQNCQGAESSSSDYERDRYTGRRVSVEEVWTESCQGKS